MSSYRLHLVFFILTAFCAATLRATPPSEPNGEPEKARVRTAGAAVRSAPSENAYLTDALAEGAIVDVYRRRPDGWCAIQPPDGSYSWVFAQHVVLANDGSAKVNKDDVAARVGSRLSTSRDMVQVRLRKGETVQVLGKEEDGGGDVWYKIAPPAGEFRWIYSKDLALLDAGEARGARDNRVATAAYDQPIKSGSTDVMAPPLAADASIVPNPTSTSIATQGAAVENGEDSSSRDITPIVAAPIASQELAKELSILEMRLSRMVAEPPANWNVEPLEQAAEQLLGRAETVADRAAVKTTLEKIDRFSGIQRRYQNFNGGNMAAVGATRAQSPGVGNSPVAAANGSFDAAGTLRPVVSRRPGAPQFALVNDQGQVVTFITPSPDVNLQPYLGRRIAVSGSRGYIPEFQRAHVTAARVTPLGDRLIR